MARKSKVGQLEDALSQLLEHGDLERGLPVEEGSRLAGVTRLLNAVLGRAASEIYVLRRRLEAEASAREDNQTASALLRRTKEQLKRRTEQLDAALEKAGALSEAKSLFLANVSHELRTPMNGIIGMSELLLRSRLDERQTRMARTITDSGRAMVRIINDILDFSKVESGKVELQLAPFQLERCVNDVVSLLQIQAEAKEIEIGTHFGGDPLDLVIGDAGRIRQILTNLIGNAVKFTEAGRIDIHVSSVLADGKATIEVAVEDTGPGIPDDKIASIFEKFTQVDGSSTRGREGTGLGLSICRLLVERMGGSIGCESTLNVGSQFFFSLTLPAPSAQMLARSTASLVCGRHIHIVAGSRWSADELVGLLQTDGARVTVAADWTSDAEALASCDLLIVAFPVADNDELSGLADLDRSGVRQGRPIVLVTDTAVIDNGATLEQKGLQGYMTSPLSAAVHREVLGQVMRDWTIGVRRLVTRHTIADLAVAATMAPAVERTEEGHAVERDAGSNRPAVVLRVLVVDDSMVNQAVATEFLEEMGCEVATASNGQEAVDQSGTERFDVILMDCQMPVMDGLQATRQIRLREARLGERHVPIIALTANAFGKDRENCLAAGMDGFLTKPLMPDLLQEAIERWGHEPATAEEPVPA